MIVMTFNLRTYVSADKENAWPNRIKAVAEIITSSNADIIGVQEATYDMLLDLTNELPEFNWVGASRSADQSDEHCAFFFNKKKVGVISHHTFWLSETPSLIGSRSWKTAFPRIATHMVAFLKDDPSQKLNMLNTHLDHESEEARIEGVKVILDYILTRKLEHVVLLGDFNATPTSKAVQIVEQFPLRSIVSGKDAGKTFHDFTGGREGQPIDYIFVAPEVVIDDGRVIREKIENRYPSDHYPIVGEISIGDLLSS